MTPDLFGEAAPPGLTYLPGCALAGEAALIETAREGATWWCGAEPRG